MVFHRHEEENKKFLKWLGFVYPRFMEFYDKLEPKKASENVSAFSAVQDQEVHEVQHFGKGDQVPAEMFCVVNLPKIVSPANLILSGVE